MGVVDKYHTTRDFIDECWEELQKVTWPDYEQLKNATIVVIAFVFAISAVIWVMDMASRRIIGFIMGIFGA
ncbi:MAG: preprotein translocase subunit SecE [Gemmatimonadetes bacterium]|nr:preprotein translocase subunit SecE [Gemmatimonadota bacterium]